MSSPYFNRILDQRIVYRIILFGLTIIVACAHTTPRPSDNFSGRFRIYEQQLQYALSNNDISMLQQSLAGWQNQQSEKIMLEGDLYASLLTQAPEQAPGDLWQALADVFQARFPDHPSVWVAVKVSLLNLVVNDVDTAAALWPGLELAPSAVKKKIAVTLMEALWAQDKKTQSFAWATTAEPVLAQEKSLYWPLLFQRAMQCCEMNPDQVELPLKRIFQLKQALANGNTKHLAILGKWGIQFSEKQQLDPSWHDFFAWLQTFPDRDFPTQQASKALMLPLSGNASGLGNRVLTTVAACLPDNETIRVLDTRGQAAIAAAQTMQLENTRYIFGPLRSVELPMVTTRLLKEQRVSVTPNPNSPKSLPISASVWSVGLTPEDQARAIAHVLASKKWKAVSVLAPADDYGDRFIASFWQEVTATAGWFTGIAQYDPQETDFSKVIRTLVGFDRLTPERQAQLKQENPQFHLQPIIDFDVLVIVGNSSNLALLPAQLAYHDVTNIQIVGDAGWSNPALASIVGEYLDGTIYVDLLNPQAATKQQVRQQCLKKAGLNNTALDSVIIEGLLLLDYLPTQSNPYLAWPAFEGVVGELKAAKEHHIIRPMAVWMWQNGKTVIWDGKTAAENLRN